MSRRIRDIAVFFTFAVNVVVGEDVVTAVDPNEFLTRSTTCAAQNRATGEAKEIQICAYRQYKACCYSGTVLPNH